MDCPSHLSLHHADTTAMTVNMLHAGHSLGGGYSATLLLHLLALKEKAAAPGKRSQEEEAEIRSLDQIQLQGAVTFGAPLTLVQADDPKDGSERASYEAAQNLLASCRWIQDSFSCQAAS